MRASIRCRRRVRPRLLAVAGLIALFLGQSGGADDSPSEQTTVLVVPDGTPEELVQYIEGPSQLPKGKTRRERLANSLAMLRARVQAAEKLLTHPDGDEKTAELAIVAKMRCMALLGYRADDDALVREAIAFAESYRDDPRKNVAEEANGQLLALRALLVDTLTPDEQQKLLEECLARARRAGLASTERNVNWATLYGRAFAAVGPPELAEEYYNQLAATAEKSGDQRVQDMAARFRGAARRVRLLDKPIELEGETLGGEPFDWNAYRGKVVLISFWATWCGPCIDDVPDLLDAYERYHDRGFEIVGVNMDGSEKSAREFIAQQKIPWVNLFSSDPAKRFLKQPVAVRYGVTGIPLDIIVDRDGKVVSLSDLDHILGELLAVDSQE